MVEAVGFLNEANSEVMRPDDDCTNLETAMNPFVKKRDELVIRFVAS